MSEEYNWDNAPMVVREAAKTTVALERRIAELERQLAEGKQAVAPLAMMFENGEDRIESDPYGLFKEAARYIRYLQASSEDAIKQLKEAVRQLAETEQYLAVAEGQADDGPPGWIMQLSSAPQYNRWRKKLDRRWFIEIRRLSAASSWGWSVFRGTVAERKGLSATAREAIIAAEAAYQEAIASHGGQ